MSTTRQTLLDIYHPEFRKGYQDGRQFSFQKQNIFTDKDFVECLQSVFKPPEQEEAKEGGEGLYYSVGHLVGRMSGYVIPRQSYENPTRELEEAFLAKTMQNYGKAGSSLIDTIRQFWSAQDHLAQILDADTFEVMLHRGLQKV